MDKADVWELLDQHVTTWSIMKRCFSDDDLLSAADAIAQAAEEEMAKILGMVEAKRETAKGYYERMEKAEQEVATLQAQVAVMAAVLEEADGIVLGREKPTLGTHIRIKDAISAAPKVVWHKDGQILHGLLGSTKVSVPGAGQLELEDDWGDKRLGIHGQQVEVFVVDCSVKAGCSRAGEQGQESEQEE